MNKPRGAELKPYVMCKVIERPGITRNEIISLSDLSQPTISNTLRKLVDLGYVKEKYGPTHRKNSAMSRSLHPTYNFWAAYTTLKELILPAISDVFTPVFEQAKAEKVKLCEDTLMYDDDIVDEARQHYGEPVRGRRIESPSERKAALHSYVGKIATLSEVYKLPNPDDLFAGTEGWNLFVTAEVLSSASI